MSIQTKDKNDLLKRLDYYLCKHGKTIVVNAGRAAFMTWLMNEMLTNGRKVGTAKTYLRTNNRRAFNSLLRTCGVVGGIYSCTDLNAIKKVFEEVVKNNTVAAQAANAYGNGNMVSAFRYFIEFLLDQNGIII